MKIAVTGATGFVGRYVVDELKKRGIEPIVVCRPCRETSSGLIAENVVVMDLRSPPDDPFLVMGEPEALIHLAWGGLPNYQSEHHMSEELPTQKDFLSATIGGGLKNLLVAGTCLEYGPRSGELREDMEPHPETPYGSAKNGLRLELESLKQTAHFNLTWSRLFYLYGIGQAPSSLYSQLRNAVQHGARGFDMSGGQQIRDYLPIEKAAQYLVSLALLRRDLGCINVCSGEPISVRSLVDRWIRDNHWSIDLNVGRYPYPDYESMEFWGDASKLRQLCEAA